MAALAAQKHYYKAEVVTGVFCSTAVESAANDKDCLAKHGTPQHCLTGLVSEYEQESQHGWRPLKGFPTKKHTKWHDLERM